MLSPDNQRLEHIVDYCIDIEDTIARFGESFDSFGSDTAYQQSVSFCILQIGELVGGLSERLKSDLSNKIPFHKIRGMRNMVVHDYGNVNLMVLWLTAKNDIPELKHHCIEVLTNEGVWKQ